MAGKTNQVLAALTALWSGAPAFTGVKVQDGPAATQDPSLEWLLVGLDGLAPSGARMVSIKQRWMTYGKTLEEAGTVTNALVIRNGSPDLVGARTRAYSLLSSAEAALRADFTIGGLVIDSRISGHDYFPVIGTAGAVARITFTVDYRAEI